MYPSVFLAFLDATRKEKSNPAQVENVTVQVPKGQCPIFLGETQVVEVEDSAPFCFWANESWSIYSLHYSGGPKATYPLRYCDSQASEGEDFRPLEQGIPH